MRLAACCSRSAAASASSRCRSTDAHPRCGASRNSRRTCGGSGPRDGLEMPNVSLLFHDVFATDPAESGFRSPAADRYKLSVRDFEAQLEPLTRLRATDCGLQARLTFDDGGVS